MLYTTEEEMKYIIRNLPFTRDNFEQLKEELIKSIYPKSISEQVEDKMSGIDRNFKEQELEEDFNAMSDYYEDNPEW